MHEVLVNRLEGLSLPRNRVVRLTVRPEMTLDVYRGRKTTMQQQQQQQTVQEQQYFPFYQHVLAKSDDSQISESQICIIHVFSKTTAA